MLRIACAVLKEKRRGIYFAFGFFLCFVFCILRGQKRLNSVDKTEEEVMAKNRERLYNFL